jgi:hypothetical protein
MISRRKLVRLLGAAGAASRWQEGAIAATPRAEEAAWGRVASVVRQFDAQGIHRTATDVDGASAHWLAAALQDAGIDARVESFRINRIDLGDTFLEAQGKQLGGVPLFDAGFTDAQGITGKIGPVGSDADIALYEAAPTDSTERPGPLRAALDARHKAVAIITNGGRPGLSLINAAKFLSPEGVPALQLSSVDAVWLRELAATGTQARMVCSAERHPADALNVVGTLPGSDRSAAPLVIMTPRSGWWNCAGERAGGIAAWLEVARAAVAARPLRDVHFVASSGHELGQIGLDAYLSTRPALAARAALWVHFGANIGAGPHIRLQSADLAIQQQAVAALSAQGLTVAQMVAPGVAPGGEAGTIFRRRGRYVSLQGDNALFHNPADRWPEAVDVALATRQAAAFAGLVVRLASGTGAG